MKKYERKKFEKNFKNDELLDIQKELEEKLGIKIYFDYRAENIDSENKGKIYLYDDKNKIIGKIWGDIYSLSDDFFTDSHLGISVEKDFFKKGFGNLMFDLYKKWSETNEDIFIPEEEFAKTKSRVLFLLNNGYSLEAVWKNYDFEILNQEIKEKIIEEVKKDFYGVFRNTYLFKRS